MLRQFLGVADMLVDGARSIEALAEQSQTHAPVKKQLAGR